MERISLFDIFRDLLTSFCTNRSMHNKWLSKVAAILQVFTALPSKAANSVYRVHSNTCSISAIAHLLIGAPVCCQVLMHELDYKKCFIVTVKHPLGRDFFSHFMRCHFSPPPGPEMQKTSTPKHICRDFRSYSFFFFFKNSEVLVSSLNKRNGISN